MRFYLVLAGCLAMFAVIFGAFAAHGLKGQLSSAMLSVFQTGVQYQMYHSLAIIMSVLLYRQYSHLLFLWSARFMLAGVMLFSGSLYLLALTGIKWFGPVTPVGGVCFIVGWLLLIIAAYKSVSSVNE